MNRLVLLQRGTRACAALRAARVQQVPVRFAGAVAHHDDHHGHHEVYGPPATMDDVPVPHQPFEPVYKALQSKFNMMMYGSLGVLVALTALIFYLDLVYDIREAAVYRKRKVGQPAGGSD